MDLLSLHTIAKGFHLGPLCVQMSACHPLQMSLLKASWEAELLHACWHPLVARGVGQQKLKVLLLKREHSELRGVDNLF